MNPENWTERTELMLGSEKLEKLKNSNVLIVGLGGVGGYAAELIARAGVGRMTIVDGDTVSHSNRNRQLLALIKDFGKNKANVMAERIREINPDIELTVIDEFIKDERIVEIVSSEKFDYAVDAIDTLSPKLFLIKHCMDLGLKLVSSMGAGGKMDPSKIIVADISKTYNCKLAAAIRKRLKKQKIYKGFKTVFSSEPTDKDAVVLTDGEDFKKSTVGTISYMPPIFGCICASVVIRDLADR